ncbi:MAG: hypothetical protein PF692_15090 [Kiritimatiellae bacterium]|jgi:hypothetical protein|nr:hypothetical protein [Kiritimatiellia bacterium]
MSDVVVEIQQPEKKHGCLKALGIGCLVVLILGVVGGFFAFKGIKGLVFNVANKYTSTAAVELPVVDASEDEIVDTLNRVDDFVYAIDKGEKADKLVLTPEDINILIQEHEELSEIADVLYVDIKGDKIYADVSASLDKLGKVTDLDENLKGRYLNGTVVFQVEMAAGRLVLYLDSVTVGDKVVPEAFMQALRAENLAKEVNQNPDVVEVLDKLESIKVKDGELFIVPK